MRARATMILCCLLVSACDAPEVANPVDEVMYERPADVKSLFSRAEECQHWAGEEAYNAARGKEILQAVHRLRCETLDDDYVRLHEKYADEAAVIKDMEATNTKNNFEFVYPPK